MVKYSQHLGGKASQVVDRKNDTGTGGIELMQNSNIFGSRLDGVLYVIYVGFLGTIGNYTFMNLELGLHWGFNLFLILVLTGVPLIVGIWFDEKRYLRAYLITVIIAVSAVAYATRVVVPEAEPERASAYAVGWLEQLSSNPNEAFKVYRGPMSYKRWLPGALAKVDKSQLRVDYTQKFAPETQEGRGDCNVYHVYFLHPTGSARVGIHQCYDDGLEFEVSSADVTIDSETVRNSPKN